MASDYPTVAEELIGRTRELGIHLWASNGMLNFRAPRAAVSEELRSELLANKATLIDALSGPLYERVPDARTVDLSPDLEADWNRTFSGEVGVCYTNVTNVMCQFKCPVDVPALERALERLIRPHDARRCRLARRAGGLQLVFDRTPTLAVVDLSACAPSEIYGALMRAARDVVWTPFALDECLFRPFAIRLSAADFAIGFVAHHFIVDGWSFDQIPGFWMTEYERQLRTPRKDDTPPEFLRYSDFLLGREKWSKSENFRRRLRYWRETLHGASPSRLPPDRAAHPEAIGLHGGHLFNIEADRVKRLGRTAAAHGTTLSDILLAGVVIALQRRLGTSDICVRHLWHGREEPRLFEMIGSTLNPVVLRIRLDPRPRLADVAREIHRIALEAFANHVPGHDLDRILGESDATALVQTNFRIREVESDVAPVFEQIPIWNSERAFATPRFLRAHDINLSIVGGAVRAQIAYLENVYDADTIARFVDAFDDALEHRLPAG